MGTFIIIFYQSVQLLVIIIVRIHSKEKLLDFKKQKKISSNFRTNKHIKLRFGQARFDSS